MRAESYQRQTKVFTSINYIIPSIQRQLQPEVVDNIYKAERDWYDHHRSYLLSKTISIAVCDGVEYIIDGQHRMAAYQRLSKEFPERKIIIHVEYFFCKDMESV